MTDHKHLQYCLKQIEQKLDWGVSHSWKETEFLRLSEMISKETEILISPHTLKRLYGKIKYKKHSNPQRATRDALAKFIGYNNWIEFASDAEIKNKIEPQQEKRKLWKTKKFKIGIPILFGLGLLLLLNHGTNKPDLKKEHQNTQLVFETIDSIGYVPYTVSVKYDIKEIQSDSVYIDFNITHPINGPEKVKLNKNNSLYNYTYQIPGYYKISLNSNGHQLDVKDVLAVSQDWDTYFYPEAKPGPWLDNKIQSLMRTGNLYYSPEEIAERGFNINSVFYIDHRLFKEFEIDGDNFEMEVRFKNSEETGGITCFDFLTNLYCEKNLNYFTLMETGCSSHSKIKVGNTEITGAEENLSSFTFNNERWNNLYVMIKDKKVQVLMNDELIYSGNYEGSNGNIVGIEHKFKGTGKLDYVRLKDLGTQNVFFDDFE